VIEAETAEAGLRLARRSDQPFDLILTDVVLPGLSGIEMVKTLQPLQSTTVLYMTGYSDLVIEGQGPAENDPLIVKPFSAQELLRTVRNVLDGAA
jgi:DNA-binding response OmpR family regulator